MIIGLTGQTGSGKSTLCEYLEEKGFFTCNCDEIAKEVRSDAGIIMKIADVFGFDIIEENGTVNRKKLASRAFKNREATEKLNSIMHPEILSRAFDRMNDALRSGYKYAVLDAPLLFESGADKKCDFIVAVTAGRNERLSRIMLRDSINEQEALSRLNVQHNDGFYTEKADYVIVNDSLDTLGEKADMLIRALGDYTSSEE